MFFVVIATSILILSNNIIDSINIFVVTFLAYFVTSKRSLIIFFKACICLRNLFCLCFFKILFFLLYAQTYVSYLQEIQYCRHNCLIFLIIFVHFVVYFSLILVYNLVYKVNSLMIFFKTSSSLIVYLLMYRLFIKLFDSSLNSSFFNILSNFFRFITF